MSRRQNIPVTCEICGLRKSECVHYSPDADARALLADIVRLGRDGKLVTDARGRLMCVPKEAVAS